MLSPTASSRAAVPSSTARAAKQVLSYALRLRGIRVQSHMGVSDAERAEPQELVVAVDLELGGSSYPSTDELDTAANYADLVRLADESARERPYRLLETYALRVARRLEDHWPTVERLRVAVTKASVPVLPRTDEATVEIVLGRALG